MAVLGLRVRWSFVAVAKTRPTANQVGGVVAESSRCTFDEMRSAAEQREVVDGEDGAKPLVFQVLGQFERQAVEVLDVNGRRCQEMCGLGDGRADA